MYAAPTSTAALHKAIIAEGKHAFIVEELCSTDNQDDLNEKEKLWTCVLGSYLPEVGYNTLIGHYHNPPIHDKEVRNRIGRLNSIARRKLFADHPEVIEVFTKRLLLNRCSQKDTIWITNMQQNRRILKGEIVPDGWRTGRALFHRRTKNEILQRKNKGYKLTCSPHVSL